MTGHHGKMVTTLLLALLCALAPAARADYCYPSPGATCWPLPSSLAKWQASMSNKTMVFRQGVHPDYLSHSPSMNLLKSAQPAMIVIPASEADLVTTVKFATKYRIRLVVKCSGHDYNDRSTGFGIIQLNTQLLKNITYDAKTQTITTGAGVTWGEVYQYLVGLNRVAVGGQSMSVCVAGCILGGCHGILSRKYGLGSDQVEAIRFALYNGTLLTLDKTHHASLFNAMLGSGHSTYGIALSFTLRTYPAPKQMMKTVATWPLSGNMSRPCVIDKFFDPQFFASLPTGYSAFLQSYNGHATLQILYLGDNYETDSKYLDPIWALPGTNITATYSFDNMYNYSISVFEVSGSSYARQFLANALFAPVPAVLNALAESILKHPAVFFNMIFDYGGAVATTTGGSVTSGMRSAMFEMMVAAKWTDPKYDQTYLPAVSAVANGLYLGAPHSYVNEYTTWYSKYNAMPDWKQRFYANYSSLLAVKQAYDPCNLYTVEYGIGSDLLSGTCRRN